MEGTIEIISHNFYVRTIDINVNKRQTNALYRVLPNDLELKRNHVINYTLEEQNDTLMAKAIEIKRIQHEQ